MAHTIQLTSGRRAAYNEDLSGNVLIMSAHGKRVCEISGADLLEIAAAHVRNTQAVLLESKSDAEVLGIPEIPHE